MCGRGRGCVYQSMEALRRPLAATGASEGPAQAAATAGSALAAGPRAAAPLTPAAPPAGADGRAAAASRRGRAGPRPAAPSSSARRWRGGGGRAGVWAARRGAVSSPAAWARCHGRQHRAGAAAGPLPLGCRRPGAPLPAHLAHVWRAAVQQLPAGLRQPVQRLRWNECDGTNREHLAAAGPSRRHMRAARVGRWPARPGGTSWRAPLALPHSLQPRRPRHPPWCVSRPRAPLGAPPPRWAPAPAPAAPRWAVQGAGARGGRGRGEEWGGPEGGRAGLGGAVGLAGAGAWRGSQPAAPRPHRVVHAHELVHGPVEPAHEEDAQRQACGGTDASWAGGRRAVGARLAAGTRKRCGWSAGTETEKRCGWGAGTVGAAGRAAPGRGSQLTHGRSCSQGRGLPALAARGQRP